ncbi:hypothetical protein I203_100662 [Kwoniella mangroviensis CBS 8507]|uniref:uncharacterized protein n=1 Tax=Kwoniella mangroviensis CBS 8507 TaxID=1296122 RepID=UPI00080CEC2D|nr:uncharacterized protein I203_06803 [Kwoniella mangroviensis CBS 8507]OCF64219.1 hypothetical protein I203_06803 [Kwoniella mangroviensis CBS 8507]
MNTTRKDKPTTEDYFSYNPEDAPLGSHRHPINTVYTSGDNEITYFPMENDIGDLQCFGTSGFSTGNFGLGESDTTNMGMDNLQTEFSDTHMASECSFEYVDDPFLKPYTDDAYWHPPAESAKPSVFDLTAGPEAGNSSNTALDPRTNSRILAREIVASTPQGEQVDSPSMTESSHKTQEELENTEAKTATGPSAKVLRNRKESQNRRDRKAAWEEKAKATLSHLNNDRLEKQNTLTLLRSETYNPAWNYSQTWILLAEWNCFRMTKSKYSPEEIDEQLRISERWKPGPKKRKHRNLYKAAKSRYNVEDRGVKLVNDLQSCWNDCVRLDLAIQAWHTEEATALGM